MHLVTWLDGITNEIQGRYVLSQGWLLHKNSLPKILPVSGTSFCVHLNDF